MPLKNLPPKGPEPNAKKPDLENQVEELKKSLVGRNASQQRMEELKIRIIERANRDMDVTMRVIKNWVEIV